MSLTFKRTKILATLGPATNSFAQIESLIKAGANGFRLNFSHGSYDERVQQIAWVRQASSAAGKPVSILQDLQGPKIRLGMLKSDTPVRPDDILTLDFEAEHEGLVLPVQYNLASKVQSGQRLYIFDGTIQGVVTEISSPSSVQVKVLTGGTLMSKKGINLPDTNFDGDILTPKDVEDIRFGASQDIDYVALSFVQSPDDILRLRDVLDAEGSRAKVIAKIETKAAIEDALLEPIIEASDGVMIARGDLAVEAGAEVVPVVQRKIIALCRKHAKLSIVATQMMASMVEASEPTRAEVSDVATAVILGADTVMLSDETANGQFPVEAVAAMKRVIVYTQENADVFPLHSLVRSESAKSDAISVAAVSLAEQMDVAAIVAETKTGRTATNVSAHRPDRPILCVTSDARVAQQLALWYGTKITVVPDSPEAGLNAARDLKNNGFFDQLREISLVVISGVSPGVAGTTNTIQFQVI